MRRGESARENVLRVAIASLLAASLVQIAQRGEILLTAPRTIVSNGLASFYDPLLVFLSEVSRSIPAGATVSLVAPSGRDPANWMDYMVAIGQLPKQRVVFAPRFIPSGAPGEAPRFAVCYGGEFRDPRYRLVRVFPEGGVYEAVR